MKMNVSLDEGLETSQEETHENKESFGWWLSDILSKPHVFQPDNFKNDEFDSGVCLENPRLTSEESLTSGSQLDKSDLNTKVLGLEYECICRSASTEEHVRSKLSLLTSARSKLKFRRLKMSKSIDKVKDNPSGDKFLPTPGLKSTMTVLNNGKRLNNNLPSTNPLLSLINPDSPNCKQLEAILTDIPMSSAVHHRRVESVNNAETLYEISRKQKLYFKESKSHELQQTHDEEVRGVLNDMVQCIEHEASDKDLEETRGLFLKTASGLDTKLRNLEVDIQQLHTDANNLYNDFQVQEENLSRITDGARGLVSDLQNLRYLDDLIFLLQGQLDRITLRKWPFVLAHVLPQQDSSQELNLVV